MTTLKLNRYSAAALLYYYSDDAKTSDMLDGAFQHDRQGTILDLLKLSLLSARAVSNLPQSLFELTIVAVDAIRNALYSLYEDFTEDATTDELEILLHYYFVETDETVGEFNGGDLSLYAPYIQRLIQYDLLSDEPTKDATTFFSITDEGRQKIKEFFALLLGSEDDEDVDTQVKISTKALSVLREAAIDKVAHLAQGLTTTLVGESEEDSAKRKTSLIAESNEVTDVIDTVDDLLDI